MASLVIATGSGLISGVPNTYNDFNAYINGFGIGGLSVNVDGPSRCDVRFKDFRDGNVKVSYLPTSPGEYRISVKYDGLAIRGSPFKVIIRGQQPRKYIPTRDREETMYRFQAPQQRAGPVRASGRGLFTGIVNIPNEVIVDVSEAAPGRLTWTVEGPAHVEARTSRLENGIYRLYYKPFASGDYTIRIKYAERDIIGSPFHVRVL